MVKSVIDDMNDPEFRRLLSQEDLILDFTETICDLLEKEKISRKELADLLGKSKGFVSQLLNGGRNLTLRTVADILHVLGYRASLTPFKEGEQRQASNVIESQYIFKWPPIPEYKWRKLKSSSADNYLDINKAISR